jgi:hypothetical protein
VLIIHYLQPKQPINDVLMTKLPLRKMTALDIPLSNSSKKAIESGEAQKCMRVAPTRWTEPQTWPLIAQAAIQHNFRPEDMSRALKATPGLRAIFNHISRGTLHKMMERTGSLEEPRRWSQKTLQNVQLYARQRNEEKTLGRPKVLVSESETLYLD